MGGGLANSRHAPLVVQKPRSSAAETALRRSPTPPWRPHSTPVESINPALAGRRDRAPLSSSPVLELVRFTRIVRRLKWKLPFLDEGYRRAIDRVGRDRVQVEEAELMFKLDFFEFYALIERALVHLMAVYGIQISAGFIGEWKSESSFEYHAYHANVLSALDDPKNPLHRVLGTGEVRWQLGRAKELRNRWKSGGEGFADDNNPYQGRNRSPHSAGRWSTKKVAAPLESYRLEEILKAIFAGLDAAFAVAQRFVEMGVVETFEDGNWPSPDGDIDMVDWSIAAAAAAGEDLSDESQWMFMTDAMDWEAV